MYSHALVGADEQAEAAMPISSLSSQLSRISGQAEAVIVTWNKATCAARCVVSDTGRKRLSARQLVPFQCVDGI